MVIAGQGFSPESVFTSGRAAAFIASIAAHAGIMAAPDPPWDATFLPHEEGRTTRNITIGGAVLWALRGHAEADNAGTAAFLAHLAKPKTQMWWHKITGYVPATNAAYAMAKAERWYTQRSTQ